MNILIPTDLSEESIQSLPEILRLFPTKGTIVTLVHIVEPRTGGSTLVLNVDDIIYEESKGKLDRLVVELETMFAPNVTFQKRIISGYFQQKLNKVLAEMLPDLVVMNSKSRLGVDKILERRQTMKFIGEINQPLLIVPFGFSIERVKTIGLGVDQREPLSSESAKKIQLIANELKAEVKLFHVHDFTENDLSYYDQKAGGLKEIAGDVELIIEEKVQDGIEQWMENHTESILGLVTHNKNFFTRIFSPGVTKLMAKRNKNLLLILTQF